MIGAQKMVIAAVAAGMLTAGGAASMVSGPTGTSAPTMALSAFSTPLNNDNGNWDHNRGRDRPGDRGGNWGRDHDNDHGRGWDGDRRRDGDWDGHPWRWWHDWGISADLCRDGGGHVRWDQHRCEGGRFDDFHVR